MSSFEVLSWGTLTKLSPFKVERDFFDLVGRFRFISCNVISTRKAFQILDKGFLQFPRTFYI